MAVTGEWGKYSLYPDENEFSRRKSIIIFRIIFNLPSHPHADHTQHRGGNDAAGRLPAIVPQRSPSLHGAISGIRMERRLSKVCTQSLIRITHRQFTAPRKTVRFPDTTIRTSGRTAPPLRCPISAPGAGEWLGLGSTCRGSTFSWPLPSWANCTAKCTH